MTKYEKIKILHSWISDLDEEALDKLIIQYIEDDTIDEPIIKNREYVMKRETESDFKYLIEEESDCYVWGAKEEALLFSEKEAQNKADEFDFYVGVEQF